MSQRKLMAVLSLAAVVALTAGESQASLSRVEGMSLAVPTLSQFTDDYVNIYYYPASVVRQNNLVLAELGNNPSGLSDTGLLGSSVVTFGEQSYTVIRNFPRIGAIAFQMKQSSLNNLVASGSLNNEQLDAIWGKGFSGLDFAVRVEINTIGITPGVTFHLSNDNRVEGAVTYRKYSMDRTASTGGVQNESWKDDGSASYAIFGRAFLNQGDRHVWVPAAFYTNDDLSWRVQNVPAAGNVRSADEKYKSYGVGISDNMRVNDNNLLLWGVTVGQTKHTYERTDGALAAGDQAKFEEKSTVMPLVFAAIETDATRWLKVRIGANRALVSDRTEDTTFGTPSTIVTDKERTSNFNFSLGTGIRWNNLDIDMTLNEKFPLTGGYILSGDRSTPFTRASATYHY